MCKQTNKNKQLEIMEYYFNTNDEVKCENIFVENNEENINSISGDYLVIKKVDEDTLILKDNDKVNNNIYIVKLSEQCTINSDIYLDY